MRSQHLSLLLLSGLATASPVNLNPTRDARDARNVAAAAPAYGSGAAAVQSSSNNDNNIDMASAIRAIMPTSNSCAGAQVPADCRTAEQAAPFVAKSYPQAGFSPGETAAALALMGLESSDFKFKHNVYPGRPGQGTANMMMPNFVKEYATSIFGADKVAGKSPAEVLDMVTPDEHNFGSAGWFLKAHCGAGVREKLKAGTDEGWRAYMACVGVDGSDPARLQYWSRAKKAFNL